MASGLLVSAGPADATEVCDLVHSVSCPAIAGGLFFKDEQRLAGTGFMDAFLRIQQKGQSKVDPNYYQFFLDVDEPANGSKNSITLDQLKVYASPSTGLNNQQNAPAQPNGGTGCQGIPGQRCGSQSAKIYDLDDAESTARNTDVNSAQIDYLVSGDASGASDLVFYLSTQNSMTAGANGSWYVYLFSQFGDKYTLRTNGAQAGFEDWWARALLDDGGQPLTPVPEPASLLLLGSGLAWGIGRWRRRA